MAGNSRRQRHAAKVVVLITDGHDTDENDGQKLLREAERVLPEWGVFLLSCCVGKSGVNHHDVSHLALATGGQHMTVATPDQIADTLRDLTQFLHVQILQTTQMSRGSDHVGVSRELVVEQAIGRVVVDLMILIDCSYRMAGVAPDDRPPGDATKFPMAKKAAANLLASLDFEFDRAGVIRVGDDAELVQPLTSDRTACVRAIEGLSGAGGSSLFRAVWGAASILAEPQWYTCLECGGIDNPNMWMLQLTLMAVRCRKCGRLYRRDSC